MTKFHLDLTAISKQCDLALYPEHDVGAKAVAYIANAKGRATLQELSPENFSSDIWSDTAKDCPDWRCAVLRHVGNRESALEIAVGIATRATVRGCRVMVRHEPGGEFELARRGTLADVLAAIPPAGNA